MQIFLIILLGFLLVCAISVSLSKNLLNSILIFMSYSLVMSVIWILLESPDLAITEAAVGAGVTTVLFLVTLKKIHAVVRTDEDEESKENDGLDDEDEIETTKAAEISAENGTERNGEEAEAHE